MLGKKCPDETNYTVGAIGDSHRTHPQWIPRCAGEQT